MALTILSSFKDYEDPADPANNKKGLITTLEELLVKVEESGIYESLVKAWDNVEKTTKYAEEKQVVYDEAKKAYDTYVKRAGSYPSEEQKTVIEELKKTMDRAKSTLDFAIEDRDDAKAALTRLEKNEDYAALGATHAKFKGNLDEFNKYLKRIETDRANIEVAYNELTNGNYSDAIAKDITEKYASFNDIAAELLDTINEGLELYMRSYETVIRYYPDQDYISEKEDTEVEEKKDEDEYVYTKYTNDDGNIVAVTYGGKNGVATDPYKTFILNYNFFEVTTTYNEKDYTIPAFGYVIIEN
jgi:hypothetical protein